MCRWPAWLRLVGHCGRVVSACWVWEVKKCLVVLRSENKKKEPSEPHWLKEPSWLHKVRKSTPLRCNINKCEYLRAGVSLRAGNLSTHQHLLVTYCLHFSGEAPIKSAASHGLERQTQAHVWFDIVPLPTTDSSQHEIHVIRHLCCRRQEEWV